ncbi:MAG: cytochrome b/b6 domain-containing protein [Steroidobacteraceae bacterium]
MNEPTPAAAADAAASARVWDLPVRLIHWSLVLLVAAAWATRKIEGDYFRLHVWCGYLILLLAATRIVWGFIGTRHARFASFVRGPAVVLAYLRSQRAGPAQRYAGHNPLGALMVVLLLVALLAQASTGLFANDQVAETGPLFGYVGIGLSDQLTRLHHKIADLILIAVGLHVLAVLAYLFVKHENLVRPMVTGRKPAAAVPAGEAIAGSRSVLAVLVLAALALGLWWLVRSAPEGSLFAF